ncbi:MAG: alpha/beta hydrolase family protein, partial [Bryobacteraceae bacterium]
MKTAVVCTLLMGSALWGAETIVRFEPASPEVGPFPTNYLTVSDPAQKTQKRVNLPLPLLECALPSSVCDDRKLLNELDGFSVNPRTRVCFSQPVDVNTLRDGVSLVALNNLVPEEPGAQQANARIAINQVFYEPVSNCAFAKPDQVLDQHRQYALVVTNAVRGADGTPLGINPAFQACSQATTDPGYCGELARAVQGIRGAVTGSIVGGSVFTTMSATAWQQKAHAAVQSFPVISQPVAANSVFRISDLASIAWQPQMSADPADKGSVELPMMALAGVDRVAFGWYLAPNFLGPNLSIAATPTALEIPAPTQTQIYFHVFLPGRRKPANGYPVAIYGHGLTDSRFGAPTSIASSLAQAGIATIAISIFGHGHGPASTVALRDKQGIETVLPAPGRGLPLTPGLTPLSPPRYGPADGC